MFLPKCGEIGGVGLGDMTPGSAVQVFINMERSPLSRAVATTVNLWFVRGDVLHCKNLQIELLSSDSTL